MFILQLYRGNEFQIISCPNNISNPVIQFAKSVSWLIFKRQYVKKNKQKKPVKNMTMTEN